jgi:DNA-binding CsgD family transcriptional regulator
VLDCLDSAVFMLDGVARVSWRNSAAHRLVAAGDGLVLRGDRLTAQWSDDNRRLAAALAARMAVTMRIGRPSGQPSYVAHTHRLDLEGSVEQAVVALLVTIPERLEIPTTSLMDAYELTPAEARVALAAVHGDRLADTACRLRLSINTVKSTLQRVFSKTETRSRPQLVRLLMSTLCHVPRREADAVAARHAGEHHNNGRGCQACGNQRRGTDSRSAL